MEVVKFYFKFVINLIELGILLNEKSKYFIVGEIS